MFYDKLLLSAEGLSDYNKIIRVRIQHDNTIVDSADIPLVVVVCCVLCRSVPTQETSAGFLIRRSSLGYQLSG